MKINHNRNNQVAIARKVKKRKDKMMSKYKMKKILMIFQNAKKKLLSKQKWTLAKSNLK